MRLLAGKQPSLTLKPKTLNPKPSKVLAVSALGLGLRATRHASPEAPKGGAGVGFWGFERAVGLGFL